MGVQYIENKAANELEATMYTGEGGAGITAILDPRYYTPGEYFGIWDSPVKYGHDISCPYGGEN